MQRRAITVRGLVQGVGFRPFVYGLASRLQLNGFVKNRTGSVAIEVQGEPAALHRFLEELRRRPPPLSRIDDIAWQLLPLLGERGFRIEQSDDGASSQVIISPDVATCSDCLAELFDPADRRYQYAFLNCTNCGPRLTIIQGAPYDRERTTMARFAMCGGCRAEYDEPDNRRFHAQPTACSQCGPSLELLRPGGQPVEDDPLRCFVQFLLAGKIGAMKGLGGFHLVCDARNERAVKELRRRKHRDARPFAVMVPDTETARGLCELSPGEEGLLWSQRRPIVLLRRRPDPGRPWRERRGRQVRPHTAAPGLPVRVAESVCGAVAPGNPYLGIVLPYTPLHYLVMEAVGGIPLVMTSGNRSDEPIAYLNETVVDRLGNIADVFLTHNRPIHVRCDDSVTRVIEGEELLVRRSRGYAPQPIELPFPCPRPALAVGGQFKGVFALGRGRQAFLSHHLGDLDHFAAFRAFQRDAALYEQLFDLRPEVVVCDQHPDYASTSYARQRAADERLELLSVQHHHAHMASCMAEHGLNERVIGISFDGTGFGPDGAIWGGEFLIGGYQEYRRAAHLRYVRMPGGDKAIQEPWRMAVSHLQDAGCGGMSLPGVTAMERRTVEQLIECGFNSPPTSSMGRLFDSVAAIAGVRRRVDYEGQAAVELEWLATGLAASGTYPFELADPPRAKTAAPLVIDTRPLIAAIVHDVCRHTSAAIIARRFHATIVEIVADVCDRLRSDTGIQVVVLGGGVFLNAVLVRDVLARLKSDGFRVYRPRLVPPNDGGLSLGQLAIAARRLARPSAAALSGEDSAHVGSAHDDSAHNDSAHVGSADDDSTVTTERLAGGRAAPSRRGELRRSLETSPY